MLLLLFIIVPLIEIYFFIQVGSVIGAGVTVLLIILTAVIGLAMLKMQSLGVLARFRQSLARDGMVGFELLEAVCLIIGGLLLLTPGFFTDAVGFFCLLRPSRMWLIRTAVKHYFGGAVSSQTDYIEGRFRRDDD